MGRFASHQARRPAVVMKDRHQALFRTYDGLRLLRQPEHKIGLHFEFAEFNMQLVGLANMNVDEILRTLADEQVDYILIGGMNFLLRHVPELTFDVDIWARDDAENLPRLNHALQRLGAEWGPTESSWRPVSQDWHWLQKQTIFCLTTKHGALDVFCEVRGLEGHYRECKARSIASTTAAGIPFAGLSDEDMLVCQEALPPTQRKARRMEVLREAIRKAKKT